MNVIETNQNVITNETNNEFANNECENIGNKKIWQRNCPNCNRLLNYKHENIFKNAITFDLICRWCSAQKESYSKNYIRKCPLCDKKIIYKSKVPFDNANKNSNLCINCYRKTIYDKTKCERECPRCKQILKYKNKRSYLHSKKHNLLCGSCSQQGNGHPHTEKYKKHMRRIMTGRKINDKWKLKIKKHHWSTNPILKKKIIETHSNLMCKRIQNGNYNFKNKHFKTGYYKNKITGNKEYYRSSYELRRMKELDNTHDVKLWTTKHNIKIPYYIKNIQHFYIPDFLIEMNNNIKIIEEIKGYIENKNIFNLKVKAAKFYCKKNGYKYKVKYDNDIKK